MADFIPFPPLRRSDLHPDPIQQFKTWFVAATQAGLPEPNAMTLATATPEGMPSARIVLLKEFSDQGFVFFTNYQSRKGKELIENPRAALVFHWPMLQRQIRIAGAIAKTSAAESGEYFHSRPLGSQLGAWASAQSQPIASRTELEKRLQQVTDKFQQSPVPLPPHWGGFRLSPTTIEFWQAGAYRLHDRFLYTHSPEGRWHIQRLCP